MIRTRLKLLLMSVGTVVVGALGGVCGYFAAVGYLAVPYASQREIPGLLVLMMVVFSLSTLVVAAVAIVVVEHLARLVGIDRNGWRWGAALWYLASAVATAAPFLYRHYQYFAQFGG